MHAITIGLDIAKSIFQVHGEDASGEIVLQKRLRRGQVAGFFAKLKPARSGSRRAARRITGAARCADWAMRYG